MILMIVRFKMDGWAYSKNKEAFKTLLKKHGIYWKGTMQQPWWGSNSEKVTADFNVPQLKKLLAKPGLNQSLREKLFRRTTQR